MRFLLVVLAFFLATPAQADDVLTGRDLEPEELGKCRKDFSVRLCREHPNLYKCVMFRKGGKPHLTWEELFGDGPAKAELQRLNRRNTLVWRNHCLAMPFDKIVPPFPQSDPRYQERTVVVDLKRLAWAAYERGSLVRWGAANGGAKICRETGKLACKTHPGTHRILRIYGHGKRSDLYPVECANKRVCGHPMPYYMPFHADGTGCHGDRHLAGGNVSHGCVRMFTQDARWLNRSFVSVGTAVVVEDY